MKTEMYCYLSNRDPKVLPETDEVLDDCALTSDRTAVVCIDMHRGHIGPEEELTCPAPRARVDRSRRTHVPRALPGHRHADRSMCSDWQRYGGIERNELEEEAKPSRELCARSTSSYLPANPLMDEHSWEGTKWLDLLVKNDDRARLLRAHQEAPLGVLPDRPRVPAAPAGCRQQVVITATYTDACDLSTAFDAANRDYRVIVPRDIVAGYDQEAEDAALLIISGSSLGLVVDLRSRSAARVLRAQGQGSCRRSTDSVTDVSTIAGEIPVGV